MQSRKRRLTFSASVVSVAGVSVILASLAFSGTARHR